jgi:manganese oxidase
MSAEGIRPSRFPARNARWAHNHRLTWLANGETSEDMAVFGQGTSAPPPPASGNGNGRNGNGNGHARKPTLALSMEERERLKAEVVYWGLQQSRQGRILREEELQAEYDRRLNGAAHMLGDVEVDILQDHDRLPAAEKLPRDREERRWGARVAQPEPRPTFEAQPVPQSEPASKPGRWTPKPVVTRRNALKLIGLLGVQGAAAVAAIKVADQRTSDAVAANSGVPPSAAAFGASTPMDVTSDLDLTNTNQPFLAANFNKGSSLFAVFPGSLPHPDPANLAMLHPPPALPAKPGRVRAFNLAVSEKVIDLAKGIQWAGWTYNGTIPGPVIRVTQGDTVHVTLDNSAGKHPHSLHFHSIHAGTQDGVFQIIPAGGKGTYTFTAEPFGVFPYHCHIAPFDQHVARGLYGTLIIDPPTPRPPANEMVMLLNGYDLTFAGGNDIYSVNGMPGYYQDHPIPLKIGQLNRVYIVNMTEFDPLNSFHLHGNMYNYIPLGTSLKPSFLTDVVHLGIADRGIAEFTFKLPGQYLFHAHQTELSMKGWSGIFNVT